MRAWLGVILFLFVGPPLAHGQVLDSKVLDSKVLGSSADVRTILNFKVSADEIRTFLPAGWELNPPDSGPSAGANLQVTFADQLASMDGTGKQGAPARYVIFEIPAKQTGSEKAGLVIFAGMSTGGPGPYGTNVQAVDIVERNVRYERQVTAQVESWEFTAEAGASVSLQVQYERGLTLRGKSEMRVYSQAKPGFSRVYRSDQITDVVRGLDAGPDRLKKFVFKTTDQKLARLFDGTERLISLTAVPWYVREIYPGGS